MDGTFLINNSLAPVTVLPGKSKPIRYAETYFVEINVSYGQMINNTLVDHIMKKLDTNNNRVFVTGVGSGFVNWSHISTYKHYHYLILNVTNTSEFALGLAKAKEKEKIEDWDYDKTIDTNTKRIIESSRLSW